MTSCTNSCTHLPFLSAFPCLLDLCGSDNFPACLHPTNRPDPIGVPRWNLEKADWSELYTLCESQLTPETGWNERSLSLLFYILLRKRPYQKPLQFPENSTSPGGPRNVKKFTIIVKRLLITSRNILQPIN